MQITIPIPKSSLPHITAGMEKFGEDYRFRYQGKWYKIIGAKGGGRGETLLTLDDGVDE